jgi:hypothetical protein
MLGGRARLGTPAVHGARVAGRKPPVAGEAHAEPLLDPGEAIERSRMWSAAPGLMTRRRWVWAAPGRGRGARVGGYAIACASAASQQR